jgi:hypothetical protein
MIRSSRKLSFDKEPLYDGQKDFREKETFLKKITPSARCINDLFHLCVEKDSCSFGVVLVPCFEG